LTSDTPLLKATRTHVALVVATREAISGLKSVLSTINRTGRQEFDRYIGSRPNGFRRKASAFEWRIARWGSRSIKVRQGPGGAGRD
jgi:hypothetical protein